MAIVYVKTAKELKAKTQEHTERGDKCIKVWSGCNCEPQSLHRIIKDFPRKSAVSVENDKGEKIRYVLCEICTGGNVDKEAQKEYQQEIKELTEQKNALNQRLRFLKKRIEANENIVYSSLRTSI